MAETVAPSFSHFHVEHTAAQDRFFVVAHSKERPSHPFCKNLDFRIAAEVPRHLFCKRYIEYLRCKKASHEHHAMNAQIPRSLKQRWPGKGVFCNQPRHIAHKSEIGPAMLAAMKTQDHEQVLGVSDGTARLPSWTFTARSQNAGSSRPTEK